MTVAVILLTCLVPAAFAAGWLGATRRIPRTLAAMSRPELSALAHRVRLLRQLGRLVPEPPQRHEPQPEHPVVSVPADQATSAGTSLREALPTSMRPTPPGG